MAYYNPYVVPYNPLYKRTNQGFDHCSGGEVFVFWGVHQLDHDQPRETI